MARSSIMAAISQGPEIGGYAPVCASAINIDETEYYCDAVSSISHRL